MIRLSKIKKVKTGTREKIFAALGKRLMWGRSRKVSKLFANLSYREVIRLFYEIHGNLEETLNEVLKIAQNSGTEVLMEWIE